MKLILISLCGVFSLSVSTQAVSLEKRHQLGLKIGMWNQATNTRTEIGIGGVETSVGSSGAFGGISYGHWLEENLALTFAVGGMATEITTSSGWPGVTTETSGIGSLQMGVKYYFVKSTLVSSVRPYFKGSSGPFIGSQSRNEIGTTVVNESRTEFAIGGNLGAGIDFITGRHFMMGFAFGYNLMTDFDEPIGGSKNYSGPEFSFDFNWLFGKGR